MAAPALRGLHRFYDDDHLAVFVLLFGRKTFVHPHARKVARLDAFRGLLDWA